MGEFFYMGGYAFHVWTCWGASFVLLGALAIVRRQRLRQTRNIARKLDKPSQTEPT